MSKEVENLKTEIELMKLDIKENETLISRYEKKVFKEKEKIRKKVKYSSIDEAQEAFENDEISVKELDKIKDYFDGQGKSINEMFLDYLNRTAKQNRQTLKYLEDELFKETLVQIARS